MFHERKLCNHVMPQWDADRPVSPLKKETGDARDHQSSCLVLLFFIKIHFSTHWLCLGTKNSWVRFGNDKDLG